MPFKNAVPTPRGGGGRGVRRAGGRGGVKPFERGGRGRGRVGESDYQTAMAGISAVIAEASFSRAGFESYIEEVCPYLLDVLSLETEHSNNNTAALKQEKLIANVLRECGDAALRNWDDHPQEFTALVKAASRCCWRPAYAAFLLRVFRIAPDSLTENIAVLEGVDTFCRHIPATEQDKESDLCEFVASIAGLLQRARAKPQSFAKPRQGSWQTTPSYMYREQMRRLDSPADVLDELVMPTTEAFLFPPALARDDDEGDGFSTGESGKEMQLMPRAQTWHPIPVEEGWYHLLVQFLLLRADCANGLRNSAAQVYNAFIDASVRCRAGHTVQQSSVSRAFDELRMKKANDGIVRPFWNATWVGVGFHKRNGLIYVVELEMPVRNHKRLLNDNIVLLSSHYFDRQAPVYVGLIRSLPRADMQQQEEALRRATGKTYKKRFAFEVIETLGRAIPFADNAQKGARYCIVESPILYSAYKVTLARLKALLQSSFATVRNAVWPSSTGMPLESALLTCRTDGPPAYVSNGKTALSVRRSVAVHHHASPYVDTENALSWDRICKDWSEEEEKRMAQQGKEDPSMRWCHVLDRTQRAALRHIFSHRVAVVQGTPGTGKSFVGFKYIQIVLENAETLRPGPILVTAVTNHALDSVLEEVVKYMEATETYTPGAILRLGSGNRCNPALEGKCNFSDSTHFASTEVCDIERRLEKEVALCKTSLYDRMVSTFPTFPAHMRLIHTMTLKRLLPKFTHPNGFSSLVVALLLDTWDDLQPDESESDAEWTARAVKLLLPFFKCAAANTVEGLFDDLSRAKPYLWCTERDVFDEWLKWSKSSQNVQRKGKGKGKGKGSVTPSDRDESELSKQMTLLASAGASVPPKVAQALKHAREVLRGENGTNDVPLFQEEDNDAADYTSDEDDVSSDAAAVADISAAALSDAHQVAMDAIVAAVKENMTSVACFLALPREDRKLLFDAVPDPGQKRLVQEVQRLARDPTCAAKLKVSNDRIANRMAEQMRRAKVVGGTVNALLKEASALAILKPRILLVEEAGQVLEGQLIASLTDSLEHLLLIGDHRQLPPQPGEYELGKKGLDVSLMEREVRSGAPYETLTTQRRMHPEVSRLIHGYYERVDPSKPVRIEDHPSTLLRPPPQGVRGSRRTLLLSYDPDSSPDKQEHKNGDLGSYSNMYEAEMCAAIVCHLAQYNPTKSIIVLAYYSEQRLQLAKLLGSVPRNDLVKVRTVDDFQGEEEDFVILSTVRTTRPGFVNVENRACVALSRARMGCYVVGCEAMLRRSCGIFIDLVEMMRASEPSGILDTFPGCCPAHGKAISFRSRAELKAVRCTEVCNLQVGPCGHICVERCHGPSHGPCTEKVRAACAACHQDRTLPCWQWSENPLPPCPNLCDISGAETLCGHGVRAPCHVAHRSTIVGEERKRALSTRYCQNMCGKTMACGHVCPRHCHSTTDVDHRVQQTKCDVRLSVPHPGCGHMTTVRCGSDRRDPNSYKKCRELCGKQLSCGHVCSTECGHKGVCTCAEMLTVRRLCGHTVCQPCGAGQPTPCEEVCEHKHPLCGHRCTGVCGECTRYGYHAACLTCKASKDDVLRQQQEASAIMQWLSALDSSGAGHTTGAVDGTSQDSLTLLPRGVAALQRTTSRYLAAPTSATVGDTTGGTFLPPCSTSGGGGGVRRPSQSSGVHGGTQSPRDRSAAGWTSPAVPKSMPPVPATSQHHSRARTAAPSPPACSPLQMPAPASPSHPAAAAVPAAEPTHLPGFLRESERAEVKQRMSAANAPLPGKKAFLEQELELTILKETLSREWCLPGHSFTCDVTPTEDWAGLDEESREALLAVLPLLSSSSVLKQKGVSKALDLVERDYPDAPVARLLRALAYSSSTHINDYRDDAAKYLREHVQQQQEQRQPLLLSFALLVAGRVYGGPANVPLWSSCVCRARVDAEAARLLDPETENFVNPLRVPVGAAGLSNTAGSDHASGQTDRWTPLEGKVSASALRTARELEAMIGLESVKREVCRICTTIVHQENLPVESRVPQTFNFVFQGNPGTGKTTVARLLGKLLHRMGVRTKRTFEETSGEKLARGGAAAAAKVFDDADGGVLFIDEAYALDPKKGGENGSIGMQLLLAAEDKRESLTIILAGYKEDLETKLFDFNDGFARRFPFVLSFEDYTDAELEKIFCKYCAEAKWTAPADVTRVAAKRVGRGRGRRGFGNAGDVRGCFEAAYRRAMERAEGKSTELILADIMGPRPSRTTPPDLALALKELNDMVGLQSVKDRIMGLVDLAERNYDLELEGKEPQFCTLNRVFLGNPGTGKTTVAKLYGRILKGLGWLSKGEWELRQPSDIIKGYVGQSEEAMGKLIAQCQGKLLIIDEAYQLHENKQFGAPAISTLVSKVHGEPGEDIAVVLIGYEKEMETMLRESNPGLKRRFDLVNAFNFEDYSKDDLERVMSRLAAKKQVTLRAEVRRRVINEIDKTRTADNFGNAGVVAQAMASAVTRMVARAARDSTLTLADFGYSDVAPDVEAALACLDHLFQVESIKDYVRQMAASIQQRVADGEPRGACVVNYVFTGSPGTGKTTVARAMGKILHRLQCLSTDKVVEASGQQMLGSYLGQTKDKVKELMDRAEGGILFIDEAYSLKDSHSYGAEAVSSLVELMTSKKHYQRTVVIVAGYPDDMDKLFRVNDGLRSRFTEKLHFKDWTAEDGLSFFRLGCERERTHLDADERSTETLRQALARAVGQPGWANARSCETLLQELKTARAQRLGGKPEKPRRITYEDIVRGCAKFTSVFAQSEQPAKKPVRQCSGAAYAVASQEAPQIPAAVREAEETAAAAAADSAKDVAKAVGAKVADGDDDELLTALLAACKAAGYDSSHERRKELVAVLEAASGGAPLPDSIVLPVARDTKTPVGRVSRALRPQIPTVLLGMRNAVMAQEALDAQLALLAEEERQRRIREREAVRQRLIGLCPMGFEWFEQGGGWRCAGGSHFVSSDQLPTYSA